MTMINYFQSLVIMLLFWSFAVTLIVSVVPQDELRYVTVYIESENDSSSINHDLEETLNNQINLPIVEFGTLIYYSSNFIINLLVNFVFALPQMTALLFGGLFHFAQIKPEIISQLQLFIVGASSALYVIGLLIFLSNVRSGGQVV